MLLLPKSRRKTTGEFMRKIIIIKKKSNARSSVLLFCLGWLLYSPTRIAHLKVENVEWAFAYMYNHKHVLSSESYSIPCSNINTRSNVGRMRRTYSCAREGSKFSLCVFSVAFQLKTDARTYSPRYIAVRTCVCFISYFICCCCYCYYCF